MNNPAPYRDHYPSPELEQALAHGEDLGPGTGCTRSSQTYFLHQGVSRGGEQNPKLVRPKTGATGAINFQHLPKLIDDLVARLGGPKLPDKDSAAMASIAAVAHGKLRRNQGYSAGMLIHEARILQAAIFGTLHKNLSTLDFNLLLPDVMIIADEGTKWMRS